MMDRRPHRTLGMMVLVGLLGASPSWGGPPNNDVSDALGNTAGAPATLAGDQARVHGRFRVVLSDYSGGPGLFSFAGEGTLRHVGRFTLAGEVLFAAGEMPGTLDGEGVFIVRTPAGDQLVGLLLWFVGPDGVGIADVRWVASATLSDGTSVCSTGRFVDASVGAMVFETTLTVGDVPAGWWMQLNDG